MELTKTRQALLKAIYEELEQAYEDTLEDVLELLKIRKSEDEEDIQDIAVAKNDTTISWEEYKQESA
jgi:predicted RecB family endonuclease